MMRTRSGIPGTTLLVCLMILASPAWGDNDVSQELAALRQMIESLQTDYEQRIGELEKRLVAAESTAVAAQREAADAFEVAEDLAYQPQATTTSSATAFNPGIGAVLIGTYGDLGHDPDEVALPGFQLAGEPGPGDGLSLGETELNFNVSIDDKFFGNLTFALADEDGETAVELEEAWIQSSALPASLQLTAGRFFSGIGYLNGFHLHADDFIGRPLPYQAFLAGQYLDDGLQLRWLAPTELFLELGGEIMKGDKFPGGRETDGQAAWSLFAKAGGDFGPSHSWKAGVSYLNADAAGRSSGDSQAIDPAIAGFFGDSELYNLEFVYKWAPEGNSRLRNFKLLGEYFRRDEKGQFDGLDYVGDQSGWYLQGSYQFRPNWRTGYRHDALDADNQGVAGTELDELGLSPERDSLYLEWFNSEFSRVRFQYSRDRSTLQDDDQLLLQYVMSIGSHRAHQF